MVGLFLMVNQGEVLLIVTLINTTTERIRFGQSGQMFVCGTGDYSGGRHYAHPGAHVKGGTRTTS